MMWLHFIGQSSSLCLCIGSSEIRNSPFVVENTDKELIQKLDHFILWFLSVGVCIAVEPLNAGALRLAEAKDSG